MTAENMRGDDENDVRGSPKSLSELHAMAVPKLHAVTEQEKQLDEYIAIFERNFLEWGDQVMLPLSRQHNTSGTKLSLEKRLGLPFTLVRSNQTNPLKNSEVAMRVEKELELPAAMLLLSQPRPHMYAYGSENHHLKILKGIAGFSGFIRTLYFVDDIDFTNGLDMAVVMHEMYHIMQHAEWRKTLGLRKYLQTMVPPEGKPPRTFINDEYVNYGTEIEVIDLQLGGAFRRAALAGKPVDRNLLRQTLKTRSNQEDLVDMVCDLADLYFPVGDITKGTMNPKFLQAVRSISIDQGYEMLDLKNGRLEIIR